MLFRSGVNSSIPMTAPPTDTLSRAIAETITRLCGLSSGVSPSAAPRVTPAATWAGVPSEWSVRINDCNNRRSSNIAESYDDPDIHGTVSPPIADQVVPL